MSRGAMAALVVLALTMGGCASLGLGPKPDTPERRGLATAKASCAVCHAVTAGGAESPRAKAPGFASLEMRHTVGLDGRLAELTKRGHYGMPPVALSAGQLADLKAYIESLYTH